MPTVAFFDDQFVPFEHAKIGVMTHAFNYGTGVFEGIRAYWNAAEEQLYVFRLQEHAERLLQSARLLRMQLPYNPPDLSRLVVELLRREGYRTDAYVRPLAYKADEVIGVRLHNLQAKLTIFATPFGRYIEKEEGAHICVSSWRRNDDNALPPRGKITGGYVNSALIKTDAQLNGFDDAIVLNADGHVSEGSAQNLFIVRDGRLITSPVTSNILEGITRATIIELARAELGIETIVREIDRTELYVADEAFFCGTGVQVVAIASIDRYPVGAGAMGALTQQTRDPVHPRSADFSPHGAMGALTQQIRDLYARVVHGEAPDYRHWCTPTYEK